MSERITYEQFKSALNIVRKYEYQIRQEQREIDLISSYVGISKDTLLRELFLKFFIAKTYNALVSYFRSHGFPNTDDLKISDFSQVSELDLLKADNVGKRTVEKLKGICAHAGIKLLP